MASQLKLIQSVVRAVILGICVTSSILRVLLSGLWVLGLQFPSPRNPFPGSRVSGSRIPGPRSQGPSPHVLILDYAQIECGPFLSFCTRFRLFFVFCSIPTAFISSIPDLSRVREISFIIPLPEVSWATHF